MDPVPVSQFSVRGREQLYLSVYELTFQKRILGSQNLSPVNLVLLDVNQIQGRSLTGIGHVHPVTVGLYLPDFDGSLGGIELHLLPHLAAALQKSSCDNCAESFHGKYTVYRQTEQFLLLTPGACSPYLIHYHLF